MDCVSEASLILEKQKNIEKLNEVNKLANKMMEQRNYNNMKDVKVSKSQFTFQLNYTDLQAIITFILFNKLSDL